MSVLPFLILFVVAIVAKNDDTKRLVLSDSDNVRLLEEKVQALTTKVEELTVKLETQQTISAAKGSGVVFVRWGRTTCPTNTSELIYDGFVGSSNSSDEGAASNYLCMTKDTEWTLDHKVVWHPHGPTITGVEYFIFGESNVMSYDDAPCAVCRSQSSSIVMIPGRKTCYPGWNTEYWGYIVGGRRDAKAANEFLCLDEHPERVPNGSRYHGNGGWFEAATTKCGSMPCPPYISNKVVLCAVCSK